MISIIIPLYNAAPYIGACIAGVVGQTYADCELIIVDDGSSDNSSEVVKQWLDRDPRIQYYHKPNGGVSSARNFGIEKARGEYIAFVDSDDICDSRLLDTLVRQLNNGVDIVACNVKRFSGLPPTEKDVIGDAITLDAPGHIYSTFDKEDVLHPPYAKLYRRDIIQKHNIRFNEGLTLGEDLCFNLDYLSHCRQGKYTPAPLYYYRDTPGSLTKDVHPDYADIQLLLFDRRLDFEERAKVESRLPYKAYSIFRDMVMSLLRSNATNSEKIAALKRIRTHRIAELVRRNHNTRLKDKLFVWALLFLPSPILVRILK